MKNPELPNGVSVALVRCIQALTAGVTSDRDAPIGGKIPLSEATVLEPLVRYVWHGDEAAAQEFLRTPHALLGGKRPSEALAAGEGDRVAALLLHLLYGTAG